MVGVNLVSILLILHSATVIVVGYDFAHELCSTLYKDAYPADYQWGIPGCNGHHCAETMKDPYAVCTWTVSKIQHKRSDESGQTKKLVEEKMAYLEFIGNIEGRCKKLCEDHYVPPMATNLEQTRSWHATCTSQCLEYTFNEGEEVLRTLGCPVKGSSKTGDCSN
jgi:hypothetical protein